MTEQPTADAPREQDFLRLDGQICFALNAASRAFGGLYRVVLKDLGLTYPQYLVMLVLWEHGELPVKELGHHLRLDSGTLSPLLKRLEATGLIRRERSAEDERSVHVSLTDEGRAAHPRGGGAPADRRGHRVRADRDPRPADAAEQAHGGARRGRAGSLTDPATPRPRDPRAL